MPYKNNEDKLACQRRHYLRNREEINARTKERRASADPTHTRALQLAWQRRNPDKVRDYVRNYNYGANAGQHAATQLQKQNSRCAICDQEFTRTPNLDHNHDTGQLRGMLCTRCNTGLHSLENLEWRERAEAYLTAWNGAHNGV